MASSWLAAFEEPNNGVERARLTVGDLASLSARAAHAERSADNHHGHGESDSERRVSTQG